MSVEPIRLLKSLGSNLLNPIPPPSSVGSDLPAIYMIWLERLQPTQIQELQRCPIWYCLPLCHITYLMAEVFCFKISTTIVNAMWQENLQMEKLPDVLKDIYMVKDAAQMNIENMRQLKEKNPTDLPNSIYEDCEGLLKSIEDTRSPLREMLDTTVGLASLEQSRKAIEQTESVNQINRMALLFIPFSFMTSVFGMNVIELGTGIVSIWVFFVVAFSIIAIVLVFVFGVDKVRRFEAIVKARLLRVGDRKDARRV